MYNYLAQMSEPALFALLIFTSISFSVLAVLIVKRFIPHELRFKDNPVIGSMTALISIIYGVLAGLTALYLINNISFASDATQHEANAIASISRVSKWLPEPTRSQIQLDLIKYLNEVVTTEWPLMRAGKPLNNTGDILIENLSEHLRQYKISSNMDVFIVHDMMKDIQSLYDARQDRIGYSASTLSTDVWIVIMVGTVLTIIMNYLFAMNFYLHIITSSAAAIMCFAMIFLLITLERPYQGDFVIEPDVYKPLLQHINEELSLRNN